MVHPGTLFIGHNGAFLCIPMKIGVKSEHWSGTVAAACHSESAILSLSDYASVLLFIWRFVWGVV
jgi:hypothetical protein